MTDKEKREWLKPIIELGLQSVRHPYLDSPRPYYVEQVEGVIDALIKSRITHELFEDISKLTAENIELQKGIRRQKKMAEQEDRLKIFEILHNASPQSYIRGQKDKNGNEIIPRVDSDTDALVAAGIGDVNEYKNRIKVLELALKKLAYTCLDFQGYQEEEIPILAVEFVVPDYIKLAEKELAEEKK